MTTYHLGRTIDHVHLRDRDLDASKRSYTAVLNTLGRDLSGEGEGSFFFDEFFVTAEAKATSGLHPPSKPKTVWPCTASTRRHSPSAAPTTGLPGSGSTTPATKPPTRETRMVSCKH